MISEKDLNRAIDECKDTANSYTNCEKLATFLIIKDHLYGSGEKAETRTETLVDYMGDSEFLNAITGKKAEDVWMVMNELMDAIAVTNPRLYDATMRKLAE